MLDERLHIIEGALPEVRLFTPAERHAARVRRKTLVAAEWLVAARRLASVGRTRSLRLEKR